MNTAFKPVKNSFKTARWQISRISAETTLLQSTQNIGHSSNSMFFSLFFKEMVQIIPTVCKAVIKAKGGFFEESTLPKSKTTFALL